MHVLQETSALASGAIGTSTCFSLLSISSFPNPPDLIELITCILLILHELIHMREISVSEGELDRANHLLMGSVGEQSIHHKPATGQNPFYVLLPWLLADIKHCLASQ